MTNHARLFQRALRESLEKQAFIPMASKEGQQAAGPGGQPVDPSMGGAPMDPMAGGMPPMDPAMAGGAPPMDPMAGGMPPMDPAMAGMDPAAMGLPPMDPMAGGEELPPLPGEEGVEGGEASVTTPDVEAMQQVQQNTMDIVRQTLEMVGKAKPVEAAKEEEPADQAGAAEAPMPEAMPGPVTGQPGFNPAEFAGPLKTAALLKRVLANRG